MVFDGVARTLHWLMALLLLAIFLFGLQLEDLPLAERMEQALESWQTMPDGTPDGHSLCRLIESFPEEAPCSTTPSKP